MKLSMPRVLVLALAGLAVAWPASLAWQPGAGLAVAGLDASAKDKGGDGRGDRGGSDRGDRGKGDGDEGDRGKGDKGKGDRGRHGRERAEAAKAERDARKAEKAAEKAERRAARAASKAAEALARAKPRPATVPVRRPAPSHPVAAARESGLVSLASADVDGSRADRVPDEVVVTGLSDAEVGDLVTVGFTVRSEAGRGIGLVVRRLGVPAGLDPSQAEEMIAGANSGAGVAPNTYYYPEEGAAPAGADGIGETLIGWTREETAACGPLPVIGLVDTSVDVGNPALRGQKVELVPARPEGVDPSTAIHGTTVAALLVGRADSAAPGLLPEARLLAADAFYRENGGDDRTDVATLITALEALVERGASVINLSLSGPHNPVLEQAIRALDARGIVVIAAAGNGGPGAEPSYPAAYPETIAVTAVDGGLAVYARATRGDYVDIAAPGVDLWTAPSIADGKRRSGTSFAAPFVTAAATLIKSGAPDMVPEQVDAALEAGARDLGEPGRDPVFGAGLMQASGLCRAGQEMMPNPADPTLMVSRGGRFVPAGQE